MWMVLITAILSGIGMEWPEQTIGLVLLRGQRVINAHVINILKKSLVLLGHHSKSMKTIRLATKDMIQHV
jgi:hypothetical protein